MTSAPYGTWSSPITADAILEGSKPVAELIVDPTFNTIYHVESRPSEGGRSFLVRSETGEDIVVGTDFNVRTGVHEYGGAAAIVYDGIAYFSNYTDARVYMVSAVGPVPSSPEAVTPDSNKLHRYADFSVHPIQLNLLVSIKEDHTNDPDGETPANVVNTLCVIDAAAKTVSPLVSGADFYSNPRFSPDGTRIVWLQWFHPDMPWDGSELMHADISISNGQIELSNITKIAGKPKDISVAFPSWISNDTLLFTSDESGYQNLYKYQNGTASPVLSKPIAEDFSQPAWPLGWSPFAPLDLEGKLILCTAWRGGRTIFYLVDVESGSAPLEIAAPFVAIDIMRNTIPGTPQVVFYSPTLKDSGGITLITLTSSVSPGDSTFTAVGPPAKASGFPDSIISEATPYSIGPEDHPVHVVYYAPKNPDYSGSSIPGEKPPCVVNIHGGPTALESQGLNMKKQYYTSRGWAWLDVNHGGSSGYGRLYIERLARKCGIVDVEDSIQAIQLLSRDPYNLIDEKRSAIRGGSSGGYTTLAVMSISADPVAFAAGTSSYGISNLIKLEEHPHKFESHYLEKLVGGTSQENPELFHARSPLFHADKIVSPLLILQGADDRVVPPEQAEAIVKEIQNHGGVVEYKLYEGEGHGWRKEETIKDALEREISFYERMFKLK
ncbi:hypothetical protein ONZ45_g16717 [Pleurotus djamor]|nr:hypothetical protein ONZ45_g16717 [Pleurotus djamor]